MDKFLEDITRLFERDIQKVIDEISKYRDDDDLWILPSGINNSAGTLALHLAGNLQHFIGAILGDSGYERNREEEFEIRDVPQNEILTELNRTKIVVNQTLKDLDPEILSTNYPVDFLDKPASHHFVLVYLLDHMNYHLGQINYHRRLLTD